VIITARGDSGFGAGERNAAMNYQDPYLRTIFGFLGIQNITFISIENDELGGVVWRNPLPMLAPKLPR
jgi:FMN-dependent NADH-azoreductase